MLNLDMQLLASICLAVLVESSWRGLFWALEHHHPGLTLRVSRSLVKEGHRKPWMKIEQELPSTSCGDTRMGREDILECIPT